MKLRTEVEIKHLTTNIEHHKPVLLLGSCFAQNIGQKLIEAKFSVRTNPMGVLYNPVSVGNCIDILMNAKTINPEELEHANGRWFSFDCHTKLADSNREQCAKIINRAIVDGNNFMQQANFMIVTFGTAMVYRLAQSQRVVANCHKLPACNFSRQLLEPQQIVDEWRIIINRLLHCNPTLQIIFTVSPIRHWSDGAANNQLSKAILHIAVHQLVSEFPEAAHYFPAYEIMMDELRDYRFYADNMLHPSTLAIEYIWEKFRQFAFNDRTNELIDKIDAISRASNHRPFWPGSEQHQAFVNQTLSKINAIQLDFPKIDFSNEVENLKKSLNTSESGK